MQTFLSITSLKSISTFKKMIRRLCLTSQRQTLLATMCQRRTSLRPMIHGSRFATSLRRASRQTSSLAIGTLRETSLCCAALASHMLSASLTVRSLFRQCHSGTNTLSQISSLHTPGCAIDQFAVGPHVHLMLCSRTSRTCTSRLMTPRTSPSLHISRALINSYRRPSKKEARCWYIGTCCVVCTVFSPHAAPRAFLGVQQCVHQCGSCLR